MATIDEIADSYIKEKKNEQELIDSVEECKNNKDIGSVVRFMRRKDIYEFSEKILLKGIEAVETTEQNYPGKEGAADMLITREESIKAPEKVLLKAMEVAQKAQFFVGTLKLPDRENFNGYLKSVIEKTIDFIIENSQKYAYKLREILKKPYAKELPKEILEKIVDFEISQGNKFGLEAIVKDCDLPGDIVEKLKAGIEKIEKERGV